MTGKAFKTVSWLIKKGLEYTLVTAFVLVFMFYYGKQNMKELKARLDYQELKIVELETKVNSNYLKSNQNEFRINQLTNIENTNTSIRSDMTELEFEYRLLRDKEKHLSNN